MLQVRLVSDLFKISDFIKSRFFSKNLILSYNGEEYENHPNSVSDHYCTSLGNIDNKVLTVGHYYNASGDKKVEMFDINSNTWSTKSSFPYCLYR